MSTAIVDGKGVANTVYHGAVLTGLTIGIAKLSRMVLKRLTLPKLDADMYDAAMLTLDISAALAIRDILIKQGIMPADIMQ